MNLIRVALRSTKVWPTESHLVERKWAPKGLQLGTEGSVEISALEFPAQATHNELVLLLEPCRLA